MNSLKSLHLLVIIACAMSLTFGNKAFAQEVITQCPVPEPIVVGVHPFAPMVSTEGDKYVGFDIELIQMLSHETRCSITIEEYESVPDLVTATERGQVTAGIGGVSITGPRESQIDFTHPYMETGLAIMVKAPSASWWSVLSPIKNPELLRLVLIFLSFIVTVAHLIWWLERRDDITEEDKAAANDLESGEINHSYWPGILQAMYFTNIFVTTVGFGYYTAKTWAGRLVVSLAMYPGFILVGLMVARLAAIQFSEQEIEFANSAEDLEDHIVAVESGTTSEAIMRRAHANVQGHTKIEDSFPELIEGDIDAVVFDAPALNHFARNSGAGEVLVSDPITSENYGIMTQEGSPLREAFNRALFQIREDGRYETLYTKWFGEGN